MSMKIKLKCNWILVSAFENPCIWGIFIKFIKLCYKKWSSGFMFRHQNNFCFLMSFSINFRNYPLTLCWFTKIRLNEENYGRYSKFLFTFHILKIAFPQNYLLAKLILKPAVVYMLWGLTHISYVPSTSPLFLLWNLVLHLHTHIQIHICVK